MSFSEALDLMKQGACISREAWPPGTYIYLGYDGMIYKFNDDISFWCDTQTDILADDWFTCARNASVSS